MRAQRATSSATAAPPRRALGTARVVSWMDPARARPSLAPPHAPSSAPAASGIRATGMAHAPTAPRSWPRALATAATRCPAARARAQGASRRHAPTTAFAIKSTVFAVATRPWHSATGRGTRPAVAATATGGGLTATCNVHIARSTASSAADTAHVLPTSAVCATSTLAAASGSAQAATSARRATSVPRAWRSAQEGLATSALATARATKVFPEPVLARARQAQWKGTGRALLVTLVTRRTTGRTATWRARLASLGHARAGRATAATCLGRATDGATAGPGGPSPLARPPVTRASHRGLGQTAIKYAQGVT